MDALFRSYDVRIRVLLQAHTTRKQRTTIIFSPQHVAICAYYNLCIIALHCTTLSASAQQTTRFVFFSPFGCL